MKKLLALVLVFVSVVLSGCTATKEYTIKMVIPAGSQAEFVYSEEEISPRKNQFTMQSIDVADNTNIVLKSVEKDFEDISTFFNKAMPMVIYAEEGVWYKVGISMQNPTDEDIIIYVEVEDVTVRNE